MPIGGRLGAKFGCRRIIFIGGFIQSIFGVMFTYFGCGKLSVSSFTYGVLIGVGVGIAYPNIVVVVMKWYPNHKGLVNGIVMSGFGMSALMMDEIQTALINPDNLKQDEETGFTDSDMMDRFPYSFLYLGALYFAMIVIGVLLLSNAPDDTVSVPDTGHSAEVLNEKEGTPLIQMSTSSVEMATNADTVAPNSSVVDINDIQQPRTSKLEGFDVSEVLQDLRFWALYFIFFLDGLVFVVIATQWKLYNVELGITNDAYLSTMGAVSAIFNGGGRIVFGFIFDKTGSFRYTLGAVNLVSTVLLVTWPYCVGMVMPFIWQCLLFGLVSANFSIFPTITVHIFGTKNVGVNVGLIFSSQILSAPIGVYAVQSISDALSDWKDMLHIVGAIQFAGAISALAFNDQKRVTIPCCVSCNFKN